MLMLGMCMPAPGMEHLNWGIDFEQASTNTYRCMLQMPVVI